MATKDNNNKVTIVVIPLPLQGHLNPLLQLSHLLATYKILVHYVGFASHNHRARVRAHGFDQTSSSIEMVDFEDPVIVPQQQSKQSSNNNKFPMHVQHMTEVSQLLSQPICQLVKKLSGDKFRRIIVIHDSLMASVIQDVKDLPNVETYAFHTSSAFAVFFTIWQFLDEKPFDLGSQMLIDVPGMEGFYSTEFMKFVHDQYNLLESSSGRLHNTCRSLEGNYMDLLNKLPINENKKLFAIGPINQSINSSNKSSSKSNHKCLHWLDQQEKDSVIYVSFGTTTYMEEEQIKELAIGLERSHHKFLWVLRDSDGNFDNSKDGARRSHDQLPEGYEERVEGRGLLVRDWAPQIEILGHPAIGGFLSHCGWNSCLESFSMGVPIAAWPMYSDQPKNSVLITEVLKVGVFVKNWSQRDELIKSVAVENAVRRLMASEEGEEIRRRARELGVAVRSSVEKGGSSCLEMDSFVAHITR